MNKKGMAQFGIFLIFIIGILAFMYFSGGISSYIFQDTFSKIPLWFWIGLIIFVLIILGRKKK